MRISSSVWPFEDALRHLVLPLAKTLLEVPYTTWAPTVKRNRFSPNLFTKPEEVLGLTLLFSNTIENFVLVGSFRFPLCLLASHPHRSWVTVRRFRNSWCHFALKTAKGMRKWQALPLPSLLGYFLSLSLFLPHLPPSFPFSSPSLSHCFSAVKRLHDQGNSLKKAFKWGLAE